LIKIHSNRNFKLTNSGSGVKAQMIAEESATAKDPRVMIAIPFFAVLVYHCVCCVLTVYGTAGACNDGGAVRDRRLRHRLCQAMPFRTSDSWSNS
jgi:hypothetical protein